MKQNIFKIISFGIVLFTIQSSCNKKLDKLPTNDITASQVYSTPAGYKEAFAKLYAAFGLTGNIGPANPVAFGGDIQGIDEGFSDFLRLYFYAQEMSTDEAVIAWGDAGIQDFHNMNWSSANPFLQGFYYRCYYQITLCNEFMRQSTDAAVSGRGITGTDADNIKKYRTEARFLRAYQYSIIMDLFGTGPFVTEDDILGSTLPRQATRTELFNYVVSELRAIDPDLADARKNEYGRADKAAAWALLARNYLNANVYTGTAHYDSALIYSQKVIDAGYSLIDNYGWLMLADNNLNTDEFILTINYDGVKSQSYGGTTFLTHAPNGGSMSGSVTGVGGGWGGLRTTSNFADLFPDLNGTADKRAEFYLSGQKLDISDQTKFTDGIAVTKYRNVRRDSVLKNGVLVPAPGQSLDFSDIDFPIFRLAEMYLIYDEAFLRNGGGDGTTALAYFNKIRTRAYGSTAGNVTSIDLNLVLDERARELYWEGFRRTDLIRYGRFTEDTYLWQWKGGVKGGRAVEDFRKIYPIPSSDVSANPNLKQNPGY